MAEDLEELWNNFSIGDDDEEDVIVEKEWVEESCQAVKNCLIGKLLINKSYSIQSMKTVFQQIWRLSDGLSITEMGKQLFLFQFGDPDERDRVLVKQPWSFNKSLLVLKEFDGLQSPDEINFDWCPFWIQIHGLPIGLMSERIGIVVGESLGDVEEVDTGGTDMAWGKALRVRVHIDVSKPLMRGKQLSVEGHKKLKTIFRYERLPEFCYVCGMLSHLESDCKAVIKLKKEGKDVQRGFDSWLRADGMNSAVQKSGFKGSKAVGSSSEKIYSSVWAQNRKVCKEIAADVDDNSNSLSTKRSSQSKYRKEKNPIESYLNPKIGAITEKSSPVIKENIGANFDIPLMQDAVDPRISKSELVGGISGSLIDLTKTHAGIVDKSNGPSLTEVPIFIFSQQAQDPKPSTT